jgi:hypothetical protein
MAETRLFPRFNGDVVVCRSMVVVLWQTLTIAPHISTDQVKNANSETFDAPDLSFNISHG